MPVGVSLSHSFWLLGLQQVDLDKQKCLTARLRELTGITGADPSA
jgi:hypothetical protein